VTNEEGGEEWRISWWRRPPVTFLPPPFFAAPSPHRACMASLFGPRPVQDTVRIARRASGRKTDSNPYEIPFL